MRTLFHSQKLIKKPKSHSLPRLALATGVMVIGLAGANLTLVEDAL